MLLLRMHETTDEGLEPIETCNSVANGAVLNEKNHWWGLRTIETCNSGPKVALLEAQTKNEFWDP